MNQLAESVRRRVLERAAVTRRSSGQFRDASVTKARAGTRHEFTHASAEQISQRAFGIAELELESVFLQTLWQNALAAQQELVAQFAKD